MDVTIPDSAPFWPTLPGDLTTGSSPCNDLTLQGNARLTVDGNHPLAGKALNVRLKIHEVRDATPEDALNTGIHAVSRMMN